MAEVYVGYYNSAKFPEAGQILSRPPIVGVGVSEEICAEVYYNLYTDQTKPPIAYGGATCPVPQDLKTGTPFDVRMIEPALIAALNQNQLTACYVNSFCEPDQITLRMLVDSGLAYDAKKITATVKVCIRSVSGSTFFWLPERLYECSWATSNQPPPVPPYTPPVVTPPVTPVDPKPPADPTDPTDPKDPADPKPPVVLPENPISTVSTDNSSAILGLVAAGVAIAAYSNRKRKKND